MSAPADPIDFQISVAIRILGQTGCSQLLEHFEKRLEEFSGPISCYLQEHEEVCGGSRGREEMWVAPASEREGKEKPGKSRLVCSNSLLGQMIQ